MNKDDPDGWIVTCVLACLTVVSIISGMLFMVY